MRILHILNHTQPGNGHVCAAVDLACTQATQGHKVFICSGGGDFDDVLHRYGVEHIIVNQDRKISTLFCAVYKLYKIFNELNLDVIHAHMVTSMALVAILKPIMTFRSIATVHNEFQKSAILMGLADGVIAVSEAVRLSMIRRGVSPSKIRKVLNGTINSPRLSRQLITSVKLNHPAISFLGGLHPRKGVVDLIDAFRKVLTSYPSSHLYIIGDGPLREEYTKIAEATCGSNIVFFGYKPDPRPYLLESDIFVLASHADPAPLVIAEAREAGCAIVATSVDGIPEMLDFGEAGILIPPKQPNLLADALLKLLSNNSYLMEMRERSARNISYLTVERVATETVKVYEEFLKKA